MELTDKCADAFQKYCWKKEEEFGLYLDCYGIYGDKYYFEQLPFSMQYGVYVDFFDSVGVNIYEASTSYLIHHNSEKKRGYRNKKKLSSRHEARKAAIEKANEIYNNENPNLLEQ